MLKGLCLGLATGSVLAASLVPVATVAEASTATASATSSDKRSVRLTASATDVEAGARVKLTAKVKKPAEGTRVTLQRLTEVDGKPAWEAVKTKPARGKGKVRFRVVATALNSEQFRASVKSDGERSKSGVLTVTVWRWIPLSDYSPYSETNNVGFDEVKINGQEYDGWGPNRFSHLGAWESKYTPGRNCRSFRGVIGLSDISADGSSGVVKITAEDVVLYESPTLTPGMAVPVTVPLALPYRFGLQAFDTSTGVIESWPAIGDPALLCTGV